MVNSQLMMGKPSPATINPRYEKLRTVGGIQQMKKSRTTSAVHAEIGVWKGNPNRQLEMAPNCRNVQSALQEMTRSQNAKHGPHSC